MLFMDYFHPFWIWNLNETGHDFISHKSLPLFLLQRVEDVLCKNSALCSLIASNIDTNKMGKVLNAALKNSELPGMRLPLDLII